MSVKEILYFDRPGSQNTDEVIRAARERAEALGIHHMVVASGTGETGLKAWDALKETEIKLVVVGLHAGYKGGDEIRISEEKRKYFSTEGVPVLLGLHALSGVSRSIGEKFGGISHVEIIAHTLRQFGCEGIKVGVEIAVMAADAGLIPTDKEIIAVGGSKGGADTAIVLKAAHMNNFFDLEIREIIAKARQRQ